MLFWSFVAHNYAEAIVTDYPISYYGPELIYLLLFLLLLLLLLSLLSPVCRVFTVTYLNKPCFYSIQCCSCSVFTIYATCNVIPPVKYVLHFHISTFRSLSAVPNIAVF